MPRSKRHHQWQYRHGADETFVIAQNGIELGQGAAGSISSNTVTNNEYTGGVGSGNGGGDADSSGILVFGGGPFGALTVGVHVTDNTLNNDDVGIFSVSCGNADFTNPPSTPTVNLI